jgi:hypothetical protein
MTAAATGQRVADELKITEGIAGLWHYHLSDASKPYRGLCGAQVMHTAIMLQDWRVPFGEHFPKKPSWCAECERLSTTARVSP